LFIVHFELSPVSSCTSTSNLCGNNNVKFGRTPRFYDDKSVCIHDKQYLMPDLSGVFVPDPRLYCEEIDGKYFWRYIARRNAVLNNNVFHVAHMCVPTYYRCIGCDYGISG
jgi:hypothetical protein